jgi:hypothetical protein
MSEVANIRFPLDVLAVLAYTQSGRICIISNTTPYSTHQAVARGIHVLLENVNARCSWWLGHAFAYAVLSSAHDFVV